jgi:hypothetical protein
MTLMTRLKEGLLLRLCQDMKVLQHANLYERWMLNGQKEDDNPSHKIGVKCKFVLSICPTRRFA